MFDAKKIFKKYDWTRIEVQTEWGWLKKAFAYVWLYGRVLFLLAPMFYTFWYAGQVEGVMDLSEVENFFQRTVLFIGLIEYGLGLLGMGVGILWTLKEGIRFLNEWARDQI